MANFGGGWYFKTSFKYHNEILSDMFLHEENKRVKVRTINLVQKVLHGLYNLTRPWYIFFDTKLFIYSFEFI